MIILIVISEILSVLFNPLFGGIGKSLTMIISYIIEPDGAWIPLILAVLTSLTDGIVIGSLWRLFKKINKIPFLIITFLAGISFIFLNTIFSVVLIIIFILSDILINKNGEFSKMFICITLPGLAIAFINGISLNDVILISCIKSYVVMFSVNIYYKLIKKS